MNAGVLAQARRLYHHVLNGGTLTPEDVSFIVVALEEAYEGEGQMMSYIDQLVESDEFKHAMGIILDYSLVKELTEARDRMIDDYEGVRDGWTKNIFVLNDRQKDAKALKKRIKAYDMVIDMYSVNHQYYKFK